MPKAALAQVESQLMLAGSMSTHHDDYYQRYYRAWMHEIAPMQYMHRGSVIDVHHAILPLTAALRPDPDKLRAASLALDGAVRLRVLAAADMVLHSATHLFHDGDFDQGLRDLLVLQRRLLHCGADAPFWDSLPGRALELELARPLYYALRYCERLLGTPVPPAVMARLAPAPPAAPLLCLMDALVTRAAACARELRRALDQPGPWPALPARQLAAHAAAAAGAPPVAQGIDLAQAGAAISGVAPPAGPRQRH